MKQEIAPAQVLSHSVNEAGVAQPNRLTTPKSVTKSVFYHLHIPGRALALVKREGMLSSANSGRVVLPGKARGVKTHFRYRNPGHIPSIDVDVLPRTPLHGGAHCCGTVEADMEVILGTHVQ